MEVGRIRVAHASPVPVRRQIAAALTAALRDGALPPGEALPAVRSMARFLGVHRNTVWAAYRELRAAGLVESRAGCGFVAARDRRHAADSSGAGSWASMLAVQRRAGASRRELRERARRWLHRSRSRGLAVLEPRPGLRRLLAAELREVLGSRWSVFPASPGGRWREGKGPSPAFAASGVVGRSEVLASLRRRVPTGVEVFPVSLRGGWEELGLLADLPGPAVVGVVSVSPSVRRHARVLLAGWAARGLSGVVTRPERGTEIARLGRIADRIFADASCFRDLREARVPGLTPFLCIRRADLVDLARYLRG